MNDLSSRAQQFIARTRSGDDPCPADERRVEHALERRIASGAIATGVAAAAAKAAGAATVGWGFSIVLVAVGLGVAAGALALRGASPAIAPTPAILTSVGEAPRELPPRTEPVDPTPVASTEPGLRGAPSIRRDQPSVFEPDRALPPTNTPPVARFEVVPEAPNATAASDRLAAETAALRTAQQTMRAGRPAEALALLDQQDALYPAGALAQERAAARVLALCQLGNVAAGRTAARAFEQQWPRSPLLGRVRTACEVR